MWWRAEYLGWKSRSEIGLPVQWLDQKFLSICYPLTIRNHGEIPWPKIFDPITALEDRFPKREFHRKYSALHHKIYITAPGYENTYQTLASYRLNVRISRHEKIKWQKLNILLEIGHYNVQFVAISLIMSSNDSNLTKIHFDSFK